jgi:hypothetical protein
MKYMLALKPNIYSTLTLSHYVGGKSTSHRKPYIGHRIPAEIQKMWQDVTCEQFLREDLLHNKLGAKQCECLALDPPLTMSKPFCELSY